MVARQTGSRGVGSYMRIALPASHSNRVVNQTDFSALNELLYFSYCDLPQTSNRMFSRPPRMGGVSKLVRSANAGNDLDQTT
jgi:hypothetical protein